MVNRNNEHVQLKLFGIMESNDIKVGDRVVYKNPIPYHDTQTDLYVAEIILGDWVILKRLDKESNYHASCSINSIQKI